MPSPKPPLILIAGPTASGKSGLALALAQQTGGVILNADSAQVYRDLQVLSAAPTADDLQRADHRLYGVRDGALPCSAAGLGGAGPRQRSLQHPCEGRTPILVGGTGLYLRTLLYGIAPVPEIDPPCAPAFEGRQWRTIRQAEVLDSDGAERLNPADSARINRALEVILSTGRTLAEWQQHRGGGIVDQVSLCPLLLLPPRKWLYARCDERFAHMIDQGAVSEVEALLARKLNPNLPVMRAIGVREIGDYLTGKQNARPGDRGGPPGDAPLRQAAIYVVRASAARRVAAVQGSAGYGAAH